MGRIWSRSTAALWGWRSPSSNFTRARSGWAASSSARTPAGACGRCEATTTTPIRGARSATGKRGPPSAYGAAPLGAASWLSRRLDRGRTAHPAPPCRAPCGRELAGFARLLVLSTELDDDLAGLGIRQSGLRLRLAERRAELANARHLLVGRGLLLFAAACWGGAERRRGGGRRLATRRLGTLALRRGPAH